MGPEQLAAPRMPEFSRPHYGFHHSVDSALEALSDLGIPPSRITLTMAGRGWPAYQIAGQEPPAGTELTPDRTITLRVGGIGFFRSLPAGMWDTGGEIEPGTCEIVEPFDDPIQKAAHWIREGAKLFDIGPDNPDACSRWISLFGLTPGEWPRDRWYNLAVLLPALHRLAGKEAGAGLVFNVLHNVPLLRVEYRRARSCMADDDLTLLGARMTRLGVDFIVGDRLEDLSQWVLHLGPVSLATYFRFQESDSQELLHKTARLCLPCARKYRFVWHVLDAARAPKLGFEEENSRLGINTHLGKPEPVVVDREKTVRIRRAKGRRI